MHKKNFSLLTSAFKEQVLIKTLSQGCVPGA